MGFASVIIFLFMWILGFHRACQRKNGFHNPYTRVPNSLGAGFPSVSFQKHLHTLINPSFEGHGVYAARSTLQKIVKPFISPGRGKPGIPFVNAVEGYLPYRWVSGGWVGKEEIPPP